MAVEKLYDAQIFLDKWSVGGLHNQVSLEFSAEMLDNTVFGSTTRTNQAGLLNWNVEGSGFWETAAIPNSLADPNFWDRIGIAKCPLSLAPKDADGGVAWTLEVVQPDYSFFGQLGELTPFSLSHAPARYGTRGVIGLQASASKTTPGNGTAQNLGAVLSTQKLVAAMHVVNWSGTNMTMKIQSDDAGGFGTPTDRITFTVATGLTSEWKELVGPLTDTFFRASWTGTFTSFRAFVVIGIANT